MGSRHRTATTAGTAAAKGSSNTGPARAAVRGAAGAASRSGDIAARAGAELMRRAIAALASTLSSTPGLLIAAVVTVLVGVIVAIVSIVPGMGHHILEEEQGASNCGNGLLPVPPEAQPWIQRAAESSGLPAGWLAAMMEQESGFDPRNFTDDSNGGTWGLIQINREEWHRHYPQGDNPGGTPHGITDPMIHAEVGGRYLKHRLAGVRQMQARNKDTAWGQLPELDALVIAHNAGEGNLVKYPAIPSITKGYLTNMHKWFQPGPCPGGPNGDAPNGVRPASGKAVSPIPEGTTGVQMTARYYRYPRGGPHWGVDLAKGADGAWTFQSICDGVVKDVKINATYANSNAQGKSGSTNYIWIDCGNNVLMGYAHFYAKDLNPALKPGVQVGAGTPIAPQGDQGNSSGSHLHLQISTVGSMAYGSSTTVDPAAYLRGLGIELPAPSY